MIKKIFRYVITLVVMTVAVGLLYALYNNNIWGIQEYVADYAVILFGIFILLRCIKSNGIFCTKTWLRTQ